jgi:hypothetical protein
MAPAHCTFDKKKATDKHAEYVIILLLAVPWQQWIHERLSILRLYMCADKYLTRHTSRSRRTESVVSLKIHAILTETLGELASSYATVALTLRARGTSQDLPDIQPRFPCRPAYKLVNIVAEISNLH